MKTRFTRKSVCSMLILMIAFSMLLSAFAFGAAAKRKKIKTIKEYDANGVLTYSTSRTYDSKGNVKVASNYHLVDGQGINEKSTAKLTYWKGTSILKKSVEIWPGFTYTTEYTKKGAPKKAVSLNEYGSYTTTYKSSGKYPKSSVTVDETGRKISEVIYDNRGGMKTQISYSSDGSKQKTTYNTKYYKTGYVQKLTTINPDGSTRVSTRNKQGDLLKSVYKDPSGKVTTYTYKNKYNKAGYMVDSKGYADGKLVSHTVYTYTSKAYPVDF
ncbi:MAG: hypothetical protein J6S83_04510 [Lachnospiraceae bacterium]|nr:hypothetical protein [Lachnospiraceae bacterium]